MFTCPKSRGDDVVPNELSRKLDIIYEYLSFTRELEQNHQQNRQTS